MVARFIIIACLFYSVPGWAETWVVTSRANSGPGTLREAIAGARNGDRIRFEVDGTIHLTEKIVIDKSLSIEGPGAKTLAIDGSHATFLFEILGQDHQVSFSDLTLQNGFWDIFRREGAAIFLHGALNVLRIERVNFSRNFAELRGGAISSFGVGEVELFPLEIDIVDSTFENNVTNGDGGAIYAKKTILKISGSTFSENQSFHGGAIYLVNSRLELLNSTLHGNHANIGGAIDWNVGGYTLDLAFDTISGNTAINGSGGLSGGGHTTVRMLNTILAGNLGSPDSSDISTENVESLGSNVIGNPGGTPGWIASDLVGSAASPIDPLLGPLADHGGLTLTQLPLAGSPAIDLARSCVDWKGDRVRHDQRGVRRPQPEEGRCDSGAVERRFK
jgi:predicted outer membrane repeat protein